MGRVVLYLVGTILVCAAALAQNTPAHDPVINPAVEVRRPSIKDEPLSMPQPKRDRSAEAVQIKQNARTLAELAQTIPPGIDQAQRGVLPKDLIENLKRIEKLSRQIRRQLSL